MINFRFFEREVAQARSDEERKRALNQIKAIETERLNAYQHEQAHVQQVEEENKNMQKAIELIKKMRSQRSPPQ